MKSSNFGRKYAWYGALLALPLMAASGMQGQTATPKSATPEASHTPASRSSASGPAASVSAAPGQPTPPAHPITIEQTREIYNLMGFKNTMDSMLMQTIAMQKQQAPFVPQDVWTDLQTSFGNVDYVTIFQPIYARYLSQEDAAKALEFYRTPAGRHMLEVTPQLMHDIMVASQQKGQQVGREVITRHRPEIEAAQKKYQQEHEPQSAAPASGAGTAPSPQATPPAANAPTTPPSSSTTPPPAPKP